MEGTDVTKKELKPEEVKTVSKKVIEKKRGRPTYNEKKAFEAVCSEYGFMPSHYGKHAFIWSNHFDDYVEASLTGFTPNGQAIFSFSPFNVQPKYISEEKKQKYCKKYKCKDMKVYMPIRIAALNIKAYLEDNWDMMDMGMIPKNEGTLSVIRKEIKEMDAVLEMTGYKKPKNISMAETMNLYGSYSNVSLNIPK